METAFYIAAFFAVLTAALAVTRSNAVHGLVYLILSLLSVALLFLILGAPFAAALEVIIYAGAIMVLFVFVVMLLNLGRAAAEQERRTLRPKAWIAPGVIGAVLLAELFYVLARFGPSQAGETEVGVKAVSQALFGPYLLAVELSSLLLLTGMIGAYHLGRREGQGREERS